MTNDELKKHIQEWSDIFCNDEDGETVMSQAPQHIDDLTKKLGESLNLIEELRDGLRRIESLFDLGYSASVLENRIRTISDDDFYSSAGLPRDEARSLLNKRMSWEKI